MLNLVAVAVPWNCTAGVVETTRLLVVVVGLELDEMLAVAVVEARGDELLEDGAWLVDVVDTVRREDIMVILGQICSKKFVRTGRP